MDQQLGAALDRLLSTAGRRERVLHEHLVLPREGRTEPWPSWVAPELVEALAAVGVARPWAHQVEAAEAAHRGEHVVVSTGTASGKSLAYLLPALSAGAAAGTGSRAPTTLYLSPTKALAADQLGSVLGLSRGVPGVRAATYDGDTPVDERRWVREHATFVLTNPDMLHRSLLPQHARWSRFWRDLQYVVVDECHHYRGLFGSHVAAVLRRLRRVAAHHGADPVFVLASATAADPAATASQLVGLPVRAVTEDTSRRGTTRFWLWEPPLLPRDAPPAPATAAAPGGPSSGSPSGPPSGPPDGPPGGPPDGAAAGGGGSPTERAAPARRSAIAETADLLTDLVVAGVRTVAFVRSRRGAEAVVVRTRQALEEVAPELPGRVAAYRAGYLPEERRALEASLRSGALLGVASTNALELGIDIAGLDAVVVAGWPGTRASLWQQVGRAGRAGTDALAVLVAADDPLDTYLVHHPEAVFGAPLEATVLDPGNPYVLGPHLCAAAAERPLTEADLELFGPTTEPVLRRLVDGGLLRRRPAGWFWTSRERAADLADLRGAGGEPVRLVESRTGRVLGTVDAGASHTAAHTGASYLHQGLGHVVEDLDLEARVALLRREDTDWSTQARSTTDVRVLEEERSRDWGPVRLSAGTVEVTSQVTSYLRRHVVTGAVLGEEPLDLPARTLRTRAVWWAIPEDLLTAHGVEAPDVPGAAHAAEHAAIGLLPLVASCDRWDLGGVSTDLHPDTGMPTIFVHDAAPGGAGFAERGFAAARTWLSATLAVVQDCECPAGCPSCVQSPKCGNGNEPLDKARAVRLLQAVLAAADQDAGAREAGVLDAGDQGAGDQGAGARGADVRGAGAGEAAAGVGAPGGGAPRP